MGWNHQLDIFCTHIHIMTTLIYQPPTLRLVTAAMRRKFPGWPWSLMAVRRIHGSFHGVPPMKPSFLGRIVSPIVPKFGGCEKKPFILLGFWVVFIISKCLFWFSHRWLADTNFGRLMVRVHLNQHVGTVPCTFQLLYVWRLTHRLRALKPRPNLTPQQKSGRFRVPSLEIFQLNEQWEKHRFGWGEIAPPIFYSLILFVSCFFLVFGEGDGNSVPFNMESFLHRIGFDGIVFGIFFLDGELSHEVVETIGRTSFRFHAMFTTLTVG